MDLKNRLDEWFLLGVINWHAMVYVSCYVSFGDIISWSVFDTHRGLQRIYQNHTSNERAERFIDLAMRLIEWFCTLCALFVLVIDQQHLPSSSTKIIMSWLPVLIRVLHISPFFKAFCCVFALFLSFFALALQLYVFFVYADVIRFAFLPLAGLPLLISSAILYCKAWRHADET